MKINNYEELMAEKLRLEAASDVYKEEILREWTHVKETFEPFANALAWVKGVRKTVPAAVVDVGASTGIDLLVRDKLLRKSNWILRSAVPFVLKTLSGFFLGARNHQKD